MENLNINVINCIEFEELIKTNFGHKYNFREINEADKGTDYLFKDITNNVHPLSKTKLQEFLDTGEISYDLDRPILEELCNRGIIEPGNYLLQVS